MHRVADRDNDATTVAISRRHHHLPRVHRKVARYPFPSFPLFTISLSLSRARARFHRYKTANARTYTHIYTHTHTRARARVQRASPLCRVSFSRVPFNSVASSLLVPCSCSPPPLLFLRPFSFFSFSFFSFSSSSSTSYGSDSGFQHGVLVAANSMRDDGRDSRRTVTADRRSIMDRDRETLIVLSNAIDGQRSNTCPYTRTYIYLFFALDCTRAHIFYLSHRPSFPLVTASQRTVVADGASYHCPVGDVPTVASSPERRPRPRPRLPRRRRRRRCCRRSGLSGARAAANNTTSARQ